MKKRALLILLFAFTFISYSQIKEGQSFCKESKESSYFPLAIQKKKILWADTYYLELKNDTKQIKGKTYLEFKQEWEKNNTSTLYLREENGVVYQYEECCKNETIRYDNSFKKGHSWKTADGLTEYKILTFNGELKTPFCEYQNLMVLEAKMKYGNYNFYYLRGHGYIGATQNNKLISCITPKW